MGQWDSGMEILEAKLHAACIVPRRSYIPSRTFVSLLHHHESICHPQKSSPSSIVRVDMDMIHTSVSALDPCRFTLPTADTHKLPS